MSFWRKINPRAAVEDFAHEWRRPNPYRWRVLGVSVAATFAVMILFIPDSQRVAPERPEVIWITSFEPGRTDEEIAASNQENQKRKDERAELLAEREAQRKEAYRQLARATFVDVDAMEKRIAEEQAAEEAAKAKAAKAGEEKAAQQSSTSGE